MPEAGRVEFGDRLRRYRVQAGLTQEELAERAALSQRGVSDLERGARRAPYRDTVLRLAEALGLSDEDRQVLLAVSRRGPAGIAVSGADPTVSRLSLSSFVGRGQELVAVARLLDNARLVTLTGPGGIGKTRLAVQVGASLADHCEHGVRFVSLAPLTDPALVIPTIAQELGVREAAGSPALESLMTSLRDKQLLLVLGNFEQVLEAGPELALVLSACPRARALVTSREPLHISGECQFVVPPLQLPDPARVPKLEQVAECEAVRLFLERAHAVGRAASQTSEEVGAILEICRRLDGLPLAIELAAARTKLFAPSALVNRLERRLPLLVGGPRDVPTRQQTLRDTIAWSYDLLDPDLQRLFRGLATFVGGSTQSAVEAVCLDPGDANADLLDQLAALVDKSLLRAVEQPHSDTRFALLETIREFALDRLSESGESDARRHRHAAYFLEFAEQAGRQLRGPERGVWLSRVERELDNLRAVMLWAEEQQEAELGLRVASALYWFWQRNRRAEGLGWLTRLLELPGAEAVPDRRACALNAAGRLLWWQGDYEESKALFRQSLEFARTSGDKPAIALALRGVALTAIVQGDYGLGRPLLDEAIRVSSDAGDMEGQLDSLRCLALVALEGGDCSLAWSCAEHSLALARDADDGWGMAEAQNLLSSIARQRGELARARTLAEASLAVATEIGDPATTAVALLSCGAVDCLQERTASAAKKYAESLQLFRELGEKAGIASALEGLAVVSAAGAEWAATLRLAGAAAALRQTGGWQRQPTEQRSLEQAQLRARASLGPAAATLAWDAGRLSPLAETVEAALTRHVVGERRM